MIIHILTALFTTRFIPPTRLPENDLRHGIPPGSKYVTGRRESVEPRPVLASPDH